MKAKNLMFILLSLPLFAACNTTSFKSDKTTIELNGNPTTGYTWLYIIGDETIIQVKEDIKYLGTKGMVGAPSKFTYTIKSLKAGNTSLKFEYKRPWEEKDAEEVRLYEVNVSKNGKIELKDKNAAITKTFKSVPMEEGIKLMEQDTDFILLDVRRPDEFAAGHIPGAVLLVNEKMTEENTAEVLPNKNQRIYVYCRSGRRSKEASQKLVNWGYNSVIEIGGIIDYTGQKEN